MDLSWEICEAYLRLGYLPPLYFCMLPARADRGSSPVDIWITTGCKKTAQAMIDLSSRTLQHLATNF